MDPAQAFAACRAILDSVDAETLDPPSRNLFEAFRSCFTWTLSGGSVNDWGEHGLNAVRCCSALSTGLWPNGQFTDAADWDDETLQSVADTLRFSGFGPKE